METAATPGMENDLMPDESIFPPDVDPKTLSILTWGRVNVHADRLKAHDEEFKMIRNDIHSLGDRVARGMSEVVKEVKEITDKQTEELRPLIIDKAARDLNAENETKRLKNNGIRAGIFYSLVASFAVAAPLVYAAYEWGVEQHHQQSSITVTSTPQGDTTVKGTSP